MSNLVISIFLVFWGNFFLTVECVNFNESFGILFLDHIISPKLVSFYPNNSCSFVKRGSDIIANKYTFYPSKKLLHCLEDCLTSNCVPAQCTKRDINLTNVENIKVGKIEQLLIFFNDSFTNNGFYRDYFGTSECHGKILTREWYPSGEQFCTKDNPNSYQRLCSNQKFVQNTFLDNLYCNISKSTTSVISSSTPFCEMDETETSALCYCIEIAPILIACLVALLIAIICLFKGQDVIGMCIKIFRKKEYVSLD